ncbi:MAG: Rne/Rng family ribonuclease [Paludibacteraceae bacterium]|nr:Rne/Rng family ribonuclease [Paludibacteraceae bacterium]
MESKLVLDVKPDQITIALLEDGRLVELTRESREVTFSVGNIYLAKVRKVMPGLNASFVEVGSEKEAFLHYLDLGFHFTTINEYTKQMLDNRKKNFAMSKVQFSPELPKEGKIAEHLKQGMEILVQVAKEPISTKGPRLTSELSIAGRSLVLIPFSNKVSISQKIKSSAERSRLRKIVQSVRPQNYGVIIRTVAESKTSEELTSELSVLVKRWEETLQRIKRAKTNPAIVYEEVGRTESILRDHLNSNYESIIINDREVCDEVKSYLSLIEPEKASLVKLYDDPLPIFDVYNITKQIKSAFGRVVPMKRGSYLVIEHTEALHVIDVNSGTRSKADNAQEDNAFEVNMIAVDEVARQMRLRDMGGIVVVDLIDMHTNEHKQQIYDRMRTNMQNDSARHNVLPLSKFGLMQITRQRVRPVLQIDTQESCPTCSGKGVIRPSILFADVLREKIDMAVNQLKAKHFRLYVHPYVYAYLTKGVFSICRRWRWQYKFAFKLYPNQDLAFLQYEFVQRDGTRLDLSDASEMSS